MPDGLHQSMQDLHLHGLNRDDLLPRPAVGMGRGLLLALGAHVLLVAGLTFSVQWSSSDPAGVEAELWTAVPQIAAQRAEPPPPPKPAPQPEPTPAPTPAPKPVEAPPPPKALPDPQIAIEKEKARKEKLKEDQRREEEQERKEKAEQQKRDEARKLDDKKAADKKAADDKKKEAADAEARRKAWAERLNQQLGNDKGSPSGTADRTSGPSSTYGGRIRAAVEPNITLTTEINGNPVAEVEVRQAPDGTITSSRLVKSSGVKEWDDAVLRAVDKTQKLPRDIDGRVQSPVIMTFRPNK